MAVTVSDAFKRTQKLQYESMARGYDFEAERYESYAAMEKEAGHPEIEKLWLDEARVSRRAAEVVRSW